MYVGNAENTTALCLKMGSFLIDLGGEKHKIIIIQEQISGREFVEVEFMGEKVKEQTFGRQRLR